jgi:cell wall assembly regulator SMI1
MQIELFSERLNNLTDKNSDFNYKLGDVITEVDIRKAEKRLDLKFPEKVLNFYQKTNGLITLNPSFEIIPIDKLTIDNETIHFATFDKNIKVYFDIKTLNNANEWNILNKVSEYEITKTISSFWSNKIWQWLEKENKIWNDDWWI